MTRHWQLASIAVATAVLVAVPRAATAQQRAGGSGDVPAAAVATYNAPRTVRVAGVLDVAAGRTIEGDVAVLNGPVTIAGRVTGTVVAINADVRLAPGATIGRDLIVVGGTISGRDGASIGGEVRQQAELLRYHFTEQTLVADTEPALENSWWKRQRRRAAVRSDDRSWRDLTFTSAHTYNRVEGLPILAGPRVHQLTSWGRFTLDALGVVRTAGPVRWDRGTLGHDIASELQLGRTLGVGVGGRLFDVVGGVEEWQMSGGESGLAAFALHRDFQDYYLRHGAEGFVKLHGGRDADLTLSLGNERWQGLRARDPVSLLRNEDAWRPNPGMDEGTMHLATARLRVDTRKREGSPWGGWFLDASVERGSGTLARDPGLLTVIPRPERVVYARGFLDARRYNRLAPDASLNLRIVAGGWLSGDRLPMERRLSVGGPATLPGYDFRRAWRVTPDVLTCGGTVLPGAPALCDRVMLLQAEFRRDFDLGWLRDDVREDWWRPGFNRHGAWVLFADAGRGWNIGRSDGAMLYPRDAVPGFATFRTDIGAGIDFGVVGLYLAKATTTAHEPVNVLFRMQHRF
ncbi:MAG: bactofilin family protein [Gemmatimonadaceae bacterium]